MTTRALGCGLSGGAAPRPGAIHDHCVASVHVSECKLMYHDYAFGAAKLTWPDIDSAHTAADAVAQLDQGHALLVRDLAGLRDADLDQPRLTNWGEQWPTWRVLWTMIDHDALHGGEIGALRDLYRLRTART